MNSVTMAMKRHLEQSMIEVLVKVKVKPRFGSNALLDTWWQRTLKP